MAPRMHPDLTRIGKILTIALCMATAVALFAACGGSSNDEVSEAQTATLSPTRATSPTTAPTATQATATVEPTMDHPTMSEYPDEQATTATNATTPTVETTAVASDSKQAEVQILDFRFEPPVLEIEAGTTVTFTNQGVDHTATAKEDASIFDTGILHNGESFTVTFDTAGTIEYWCLLHPNMLATIVVR